MQGTLSPTPSLPSKGAPLPLMQGFHTSLSLVTTQGHQLIKTKFINLLSLSRIPLSKSWFWKFLNLALESQTYWSNSRLPTLACHLRTPAYSLTPPEASHLAPMKQASKTLRTPFHISSVDVLANHPAWTTGPFDRAEPFQSTRTMTLRHFSTKGSRKPSDLTSWTIREITKKVM